MMLCFPIVNALHGVYELTNPIEPRFTKIATLHMGIALPVPTQDRTCVLWCQGGFPPRLCLFQSRYKRQEWVKKHAKSGERSEKTEPPRHQGHQDFSGFLNRRNAETWRSRGRKTHL